MKIKAIKIDNKIRIIQGMAVEFLDLDFSLSFNELKPILELAMIGLIESNSNFKKWQKKDWTLYEGSCHLHFVEDNRNEDPNVLLISDNYRTSPH